MGQRVLKSETDSNEGHFQLNISKRTSSHTAITLLYAQTADTIQRHLQRAL